jgi:hypothetical protein
MKYKVARVSDELQYATQTPETTSNAFISISIRCQENLLWASLFY